MTQQWGTQGQQPGQSGQQWGQPGWNRPAQAWGAPVQGGGQPQYQPAPPPQYPPAQYPQAAYPQGQFGQPAYGQPGGFPPVNRPTMPGGPQRKSPFRGVVVGLLLLVGIGFFAISLLHYLGADGGTGTLAPNGRQTSAPVAVPEPDFSAPAIPEPDTYEQAKVWLTQNAVYDESAPIPTGCQVPSITLPNATVDDLTTHLNDLTACLWRVWSPPLEAAGFTLPRPPVTIYNEPITTACGKQEDVNAFYCAADQRIYYAKPLYRIFPEDQQTLPFVADTILAHEFGHTIQARTGLLIASAAWEQNVSKAEGRVYSRRLEMQADCLAGMFTVAVSGASGLSGDDLSKLQAVIYNIGDDVLTGKANYDGDHGLGKNRATWFTKGQNNSLIGICNTYSVPASQVR